MAQFPGTRSRELGGRWLTLAACVCWIVSLALPGFVVESRAGAWFGGPILLFGLLFGWAVGGWAAYANFLFAVAAIALFSGRRPTKSIIAMLALAATLPMFQGVIRDEGSGTILPVVSWGWGAILWIVSLVLLATAAAVRSQLMKAAGAGVVIVLLISGGAALGFVNVRQRAAANLQEKDLYLPWGMAFTLAEPCGLELTSVEAPLLPPGTIVTLDVAPELVQPASGKPYLWLPNLFNYQEGDFAWVTNGQVKLRVETRADRPVLQARSTARGAVLRLLGSPSGPVLYTQELRVRPKMNGYPLFCPMSTQSADSSLHSGYDTRLLLALGQVAQPRQREKLAAEVARIPCSLGATDLHGVEGLRSWDGRQAILLPAWDRSNVGFCSESYVVLASIRKSASATSAKPSAVARVFDRKTLRPLALFDAGGACTGASCSEAQRDLTKGVRIADAEVVIETAAGDLAARRVEQ